MKIFKKTSLILLLAIFSTITLTACSTNKETINSTDTGVANEVTNPPTSNRDTDSNATNSETINSQREGDIMTKVNIKIGNKDFTGNLLDNKSTQALLSQMPLTLNMSDLFGNEKYYNLPNSLPTNTERIGRIHTGDLMLYGSDCLVLFYDDFNTSYSYTRLGKIEDTTGLVESLGSGNVEITFDFAN